MSHPSRPVCLSARSGTSGAAVLLCLTTGLCACHGDADCADPLQGASLSGASLAAPDPSRPIARWEGGELSLDQLQDGLGDELRKMDILYQLERYERLHNAIDGAVENALIDAEVAKRGLPSREALFALEIDAKTPQPTEAELQDEFKRFVEQMPHATYEMARPHLLRQLLELRREDRREAFLHELKAASGLVIDLPFPSIPRIDVPVDDHDPVMGADDAEVTIVQFGGFQCYYCKRVDHTVKELVHAYDGKVRLVYKDFPLAGHGRARAAAVAAHCAGAQGKYWEMADLLMENQGRLEPEHLSEYAQRVGLDVGAWNTCLDDPAWQRRIDVDIQEGHDAGVTSTPTFFFNGLMFTGAHSYDRFAALVDQELAR